MIFRESKELIHKVSLESFGEDCFSLDKLLSDAEKSFVLANSSTNELSIENLKSSIDSCLL